MKKHIIYSLLALSLLGCSKEDPDPKNVDDLTGEQFKAVLTDKNWIITKYEYEDNLNAWFPIRNFYNDSIFTRSMVITPDPCGWSGTKTSPLGIWKAYQVQFTESSTIGTFAYDLRKVDWDTSVTNTKDCRIGYKITNHIDNITNSWSYDAANKVLVTSFGEPYSILDGQQEFFEMEYTVISIDAKKIELKGRKYYQGELFLTNNITLE